MAASRMTALCRELEAAGPDEAAPLLAELREAHARTLVELRRELVTL